MAKPNSFLLYNKKGLHNLWKGVTVKYALRYPRKAPVPTQNAHTCKKRIQHREWKQNLVLPRIKKKYIMKLEGYLCDSVGWQISIVMPYAKHFSETTKQVEKFEGVCM
jgi:hypothetical protein